MAGIEHRASAAARLMCNNFHLAGKRLPGAAIPHVQKAERAAACTVRGEM